MDYDNIELSLEILARLQQYRLDYDNYSGDVTI